MSKYLTTGTVTAILQTALGMAVAVFPNVFTSSVQSEASTAVAGLIGGIFGVIHLVQNIRTTVK